MNPLLIDEIDLLYANFMAIEKHAFQAIISYYDKNELHFQRLSTDKQLKASVTYFEALFETARFHMLLKRIDSALITCVDCSWDKEIKSIYIELIFKKSAAFYNTEQYNSAFSLCQELLKIDPDHIAGQELYRRVLANPKPSYILRIHFLAVIFILLSATIMAFDLFYLKSYSQKYHQIALVIIEALFIIGMLCSFLPDLMHYLISRNKLKNELRNIRKRRSQKL